MISAFSNPCLRSVSFWLTTKSSFSVAIFWSSDSKYSNCSKFQNSKVVLTGKSVLSSVLGFAYSTAQRPRKTRFVISLKAQVLAILPFSLAAGSLADSCCCLADEGWRRSYWQQLPLSGLAELRLTKGDCWRS